MALNSLYHLVLSLYQTLSAYLVNAKTLVFKNGIQLSLPFGALSYLSYQAFGAHLVDAKTFLGWFPKQPLNHLTSPSKW